MDDPAHKPAAKTKACPICGKPAEQAFRPFCSPRCRDVDLNRWLSGRYLIPGREDEVDDVE
ncbi:DNA gyrase inhibitor YacG [Bradyrhizobium lablabi]|uniref:DNA gyrase inhibitor YacG n=1 Tax=Bradyrhizobium lablabi TaxID=722472 RepID=UPI001BACFFB3|nr:DNA gyrase inhibitor YacG [Bradyrhizobium lablabi]MBR0696696.1 DNA gyrase inhibitor YacG [Bradyrhizobium lablabi]